MMITKEEQKGADTVIRAIKRLPKTLWIFVNDSGTLYVLKYGSDNKRVFDHLDEVDKVEPCVACTNAVEIDAGF